MAGKRTFKKLSIDRSEGDSVTKTIRLAEGGAMGEFSVWTRRVNGTALTTYAIYGSFVDNPTEDERYQLTWWYGDSTAYDYLDSPLWGWYTDFSYLTFEVSFENSEEPPPPPEPEEGEEPPSIPPVVDEPGTVEFYIVSY